MIGLASIKLPQWQWATPSPKIHYNCATAERLLIGFALNLWSSYPSNNELPQDALLLHHCETIRKLNTQIRIIFYKRFGILSHHQYKMK